MPLNGGFEGQGNADENISVAWRTLALAGEHPTCWRGGDDKYVLLFVMVLVEVVFLGAVEQLTRLSRFDSRVVSWRIGWKTSCLMRCLKMFPFLSRRHVRKKRNEAVCGMTKISFFPY